LNVSLSTSNAVLSWPDTAAAAGLGLQQISNLSKTNWTDVNVGVNGVTSNGVNKVVTLPRPPTTTYFRLKSH